MQCTLLRPLQCDRCPEFPDGVKPAGTRINHPDAFRLVQLGVAEPADEACRAAHGMTPEQILAARAGYEKVDRGIHPNDYAAFDRGEMVGYYPDGRPIPGPNAEPADDEDAHDQDDEDQEEPNDE